jgi:hypothetical protein
MCGASKEQKQIGAAQTAFYTQMTAQAADVFGKSSASFNDLQSTFAPIVAAGVNQHGFSSAETENLNNQITNNVGTSYNKAATAVNQQLASQGGGDTPIISSAQNKVREDLASSAASQEGSERGQVAAADYATGRENFFNASNMLSQASGVFNPATSMAGAATTAGNAASNTADQIASQNNSWVNATIGALGGVAGSAVSGGMSNLGKGKGFFG